MSFTKANIPMINLLTSNPKSKRYGGFDSTKAFIEATNKKKPGGRVKTFCLAPNELIIVDSKSAHRPRVRKIHRPIVHPVVSPKDLQHHNSPFKDQIRQKKEMSLTIKLHEMNNMESTPSDAALSMAQETIPPSIDESTSHTETQVIPKVSPVDSVKLHSQRLQLLLKIIY